MSQGENEKMHARAKVFAQSYKILRLLYPKQSLSISDIAHALSEFPSNISPKIQLLHEDGMVIFDQEPQKGKSGNSKKICRLTYRAKQIMDLFEENTANRLSEEQIELLLDLIEDPSLSSHTRAIAAGTLSSNAQSISGLLPENHRIQEMFSKVWNHYSEEDKELNNEKLKILSYSMRSIFENSEAQTWFLEKIYPLLPEIAKDQEKPEELVGKAIDFMARAARLSRNPQIIEKTIDTLLQLSIKYPKSAKAAQDNLLSFETEYQLLIINKIKKCLSTENDKAKGEELLQLLIRNW
jgi:hypothetical protein